ncbi:hypothetical protein KTAU_19400 [Thermogemmatispora aurantia]|uniref:SMP-30/Gluconolactonase/LRE-like region domain-containing protein n=1 Tax=Thermogemmatispora aurantia TaxID=2045279 RepID=A0A5J4K6Y0_9CHLR|nr:hypothetical protein [Thermogemmatispora aurantia]GER83303.1 hypothetical protein KTAU_19400 [Thermogemmatispora aurantia]
MSDSHPPIKEFRLELSALTYTGHDLVRPESIIAQPDGTLWTSDGRGGVMRIAPDGSQQFFSSVAWGANQTAWRWPAMAHSTSPTSAMGVSSVSSPMATARMS